MCGDEALVHLVLETFLAELPIRLAELTRALAARDAEAVRQVAHALKGAFAQLGAAELARAFGSIEACGRAGQPAHAAELWQRAAPGVERARLDAAAMVQRGT